MADIQVGTVVLPMDAIAYTLRTNCSNKDWTVASAPFSELMTVFYQAVAQCADATNYTSDQREAMAFQCKTAVEIINEQGTAYFQWAYDRYYQAPGHGLWGNDASCNKRSGWWYDNTIQPFYGFWNTTQLAWNAADDALALLAQEEEGEYQEELWEDQLIQNDIAQGQTLITLSTAAEKANEASYINRIQQIVVPGILITVGYLIVKKKS